MTNMVNYSLMDKPRIFRFDFDHLLIWMVMLSMIVSIRSSKVDDDFYSSTYPRNQIFEQLEAFPSIQYYRPVPKRSTLIWNPLVIALQKALKSDSEKNKDISGGVPNYPSNKNMEQISGPNGKVYWRCYFNAVSCFTKK